MDIGFSSNVFVFNKSCISLQDNYTALHIAVESAKPAVVETLLGYGADVHVTGEVKTLFFSCK